MTASTFDRRAAVDAFAVGVMLFLTFSWGLNSVAQKISNTGFHPVFVSLFRAGVGAALIFGWCQIRRIKLFEPDGTLWPGIFAGLLFGGEFILIFFGFDYTSVGHGSLMVNTMPFWVLIGAHFLLGERITVTKFAGVVLAFIGVVVIFSDKLSAPGPDVWIGDLMTLLAGALWGATTIVIKKSRLNTAGAEKVLLYQLVVAAAMSALLMPFVGPALRAVAPSNVVALLFQTFFIVAVTYLIWFWLMRRYPASGLSTFAFLTPAFSVLLGSLMLGEPLTWRIALSVALIAAGLVIVNRPARIQPSA